MSPETARTLPEHRYLPTDESLRIMQEVKRFLPEAEQKFPELYGVSFFGSRTIGREKPTSDLDMMVFYDGSELDATEERLHDEEKKLSRDRTKWLEHSEKIDELRAFERDTAAYLKKAHDLFAEKLAALGIPIDEHHKEMGKAVFVLDVSPGALENVYTGLQAFISLGTNYGKKELTISGNDLVVRSIFRPMGILCLSAGPRIKEMRRNLFAKFENDPKGEFYFQGLMKYLEFFERSSATPKRGPLPTFKHYPRTLAEGREYFSLND